MISSEEHYRRTLEFGEREFDDMQRRATDENTRQIIRAQFAVWQQTLEIWRRIAPLTDPLRQLGLPSGLPTPDSNSPEDRRRD